MTTFGYSTLRGAAIALAALLAASTANAQSSPPKSAPAVKLDAHEPPNPTLIRPSEDPARTVNGLALNPPMGWNSWNKFACDITEAKVRETADAMASNGMRDAGYRYIVVDDCWQSKRDASGTMMADPVKFPSGMKALADYIHAKGLMFGIYSDAGSKTCGGRPGSQGYEYQDARTYAAWGVDYLKYDWCYTGVRRAEEAYALMADALRATGRDIVLSICEWGKDRPWDWGPRIGNLWRTTADIRNAWAGRVGFQIGWTDIVDLNAPLYAHAGPGHWNDPDMLNIGNGAMDEAEAQAQFSLWAVMAAPLLAGNDIAAMDRTTRDVLLNTDVIAVDQDRLGLQGRRVRDDGDREVWSKPLADGGRAIVLFNRGDRAAEIPVSWEEIGYPPGLSAHVRDLWAHASLGKRTRRFSALVRPHGVVMVTLRPR
ncbi:MAG TPA: glycoside hydrolase family 27 protein [Sphingomonas sp.]|jgi:alpha-galactosidase|nr:glycoside hydrolase family 27 protein [Sphingomonas sp.]